MTILEGEPMDPASITLRSVLRLLDAATEDLRRSRARGPMADGAAEALAAAGLHLADARGLIAQQLGRPTTHLLGEHR